VTTPLETRPPQPMSHAEPVSGDRGRTAELLAKLRRHYIKPGPRPGGLFVEECGRNGNAGAGSRCDALYVGFTAASGRTLIGHEVKVSRGDWLRELDKPGKADTWADSCHAWYVVAPAGVVQIEELPDGWGLMNPARRRSTRMTIVVKAQTYLDRVPSWETVRSILARQDTLSAAALEECQRVATDEAREEFRDLRARLGEMTMTPEQMQRLKLLDHLEDLLGMPLRSFPGWKSEPAATPEQVAALLQVLRAGDELTGPQAVSAVDHVARAMAQLNADLDAYQTAATAARALVSSAAARGRHQTEGEPKPDHTTGPGSECRGDHAEEKRKGSGDGHHD
jgi:hypothetical protein